MEERENQSLKKKKTLKRAQSISLASSQPTCGGSWWCLLAPWQGAGSCASPPGVADGASGRSSQAEDLLYSCQTEEERAALTQLMGRFAAPHHLAAQLHPQRCKERQMWYLASCQDTSFFLKVRHTSPAALSWVLLSATTLPSALKMPFSNVVKEERVI